MYFKDFYELRTFSYPRGRKIISMLNNVILDDISIERGMSADLRSDFIFLIWKLLLQAGQFTVLWLNIVSDDTESVTVICKLREASQVWTAPIKHYSVTE